MDSDSDHDQRLGEAVLGYLLAVDRGSPDDRHALLAAHPDLAIELSDFLAAQDEVYTAAAPLRGVSGAGREFVDPLLGRALGRYTIVRAIARGPASGVYAAESLQPARTVALKLIRTIGVSPDEARRFRAEVETAAELAHPNIVPVYEAGEADGALYFSMKLCAGGSLADQPERFVAAPRQAVQLVATVARAVHFAHQRGVLHRDLKPSNVLLTDDGRPMVADFGLAKRLDATGDQTQTGVLIGTPSYMAPEQAAGRPAGVTTATDVYGLGAVLYTLLTGRPPFRGATLLDTLEGVRGRMPDAPRRVNPRVDRDLDTVCLKCLDKDPVARYPSAEAFAHDLELWLGGKPVLARPVGAARRTWRWVRRNPGVATLAGAAGFLAIGLTTAVAVGVVSVRRERSAVELQRAEVGRREVEVRRHMYAADVRLAAVNWRQNRAATAVRLLAGHQPGPGDEDLRGFAWHYLWGLAHPATPVVPPQVGDVYSVAFSADGTRIVTAGRDGCARILDAASGRELARCAGHVGEVNVAALTKDGRTLATGGDDGTVRLWDINLGRAGGAGVCRQTLRAHSDEVSTLALAPDDRTVVSVGRDRRVRLWDVGSRDDHTKPLQAVAFALDGLTLATGGDDATVAVRDSRTGAVRTTFRIEQSVFGLAFAPDSRSLAIATEECVQVRSLGPDRAALVFDGPRRRVHSVAFAPDGRSLAAGSSDPAAWIWDVGSTKPRLVLRGEFDRVWAVAYSPDGRTLATAERTGRVRLWDAARDPECLTTELPGPAVDLHYSADASNLVAVVDTPARVARVLDGHTLHTRADVPVPGPGACAVAVSHDGQWAAVAVPGQAVRLWDVAAQHELGALPESVGAGVPKVAFARDGTVLAILWANDPIRLWDTRTLQLTTTGPTVGAATALAFAPGGDRLAVATAGRIVVWDVRGSALTDEWAADGWVGHLCWSPDGRQLTSVNADGEVLIRDGRDRRTTAHRIGRGQAALSPDGRTAAAVVPGEAIELWHVPTGQELLTLPLPGAAAVTFAPDGRSVAAVGRNPRGRFAVYVWQAMAPGASE
jgi:eukaryotic-like serine/threonine-protein kinase